MWSFLDDWWDCFVAVWRADDSPSARRFSVGCAAVVLLVVLGVYLWYNR